MNFFLPWTHTGEKSVPDFRAAPARPIAACMADGKSVKLKMDSFYTSRLWKDNKGNSQKHRRSRSFFFPISISQLPHFPLFSENKHTPTHRHLLLRSPSIEKAICYSAGWLSCCVLCIIMSWLSVTTVLPAVSMPSVAEITLNKDYTCDSSGEIRLTKIHWRLPGPQAVGFYSLSALDTWEWAHRQGVKSIPSTIT